MARKAQDKPLFIPHHKSKKVRLTVEITSNLIDDLKSYNEFLNENGHESKLDEMVETILESIRKDKIFLKWSSGKQEAPITQESQTKKQGIKQGASTDKILGAEAQT